MKDSVEQFARKTLGISISFLVLGFLLMEFFAGFSGDIFSLALFSLIGMGLLGWIIGWFWAWHLGQKNGNLLMNEALRIREQSEIQVAASKKREVEANERASKAEILTRQAMLKAKDFVHAARLQIQRDKVRSIVQWESLTLEEKISCATTVGMYQGEEQSAYSDRCEEIVKYRSRKWRTAIRNGYSLLPIVEKQHGLCGDPISDDNGKGCGCYLYCLPVSAVHLDHIIPKSRGGSDDIGNLQALCSSCNIRSGAHVRSASTEEGTANGA